MQECCKCIDEQQTHIQIGWNWAAVEEQLLHPRKSEYIEFGQGEIGVDQRCTYAQYDKLVPTKTLLKELID